MTFQRKSEAQAATPAVVAPGTAPGAPVDATPPAAVPTDPMNDMEMDEFTPSGETGSPVDQIQDTVRELGNIHSDLEKAIEALEDEQEGEAEIEENTEAIAELPAATASVSIYKVKNTLNKGMYKAIKQAQSEINDMIDELKLIERINNDGLSSSAKMTAELFSEAQSDIKKVKSNAHKMMTAFVRYAQGAERLKKIAQEAPIKDPVQQIQDKITKKVETPTVDKPKAQKNEMDTNDVDALTEMFDMPETDVEPDLDMIDIGVETDIDEEYSDVNDEMAPEVKEVAKEVFEEKLKNNFASNKQIANMTKEERSVLRNKLAQQGIQFSEMLGKAHPNGGFTTDLDIKPEGNLAEVEDLEGVHSKMMDVATSAPKNVRSAAETIQKLVTAGEINPKTDFPGLIAEGLDASAVAYWKKLWGEAKDPEASKFVGELVKEHQSKKEAKKEKDIATKIARAYELAYQMAARGLVSQEPSALRKQAEKISEYSEENYKHLQSTIKNIPITKQASIPEVGVKESMLTSSNVIASPSVSEGDLKGLFDQAFANRKY